MAGTTPSRRKHGRVLFVNSAKWHGFALTCFAVTALVVLFSETTADPDLWGHLRFGQDLLSSGQVIRPDPYSYMTGDQTWINHEWLAEGLLALVYGAFGFRGLIGLKVLLAMGISGLAYGYLRSHGLVPLRAWALVTTTGLLMFSGLGTVRPHMFTYACFAVLLFALMQVENGRAGWLWVLPPLFVLWTNLHGGFLAGAGILLIWLLTYCARLVFATPAARAALRPQPWMAFMVTALAGLATLVNPYGPELLRFLLRTATVSRPEISEWQPGQILSVSGAAYLLLILASIAAFAYGRRAPRPFPLLAFIVLAILPLVAQRHEPLFALGLLFLAGEHISGAWERWSVSRGADKASIADHRLFGPLLIGVFLAGSIVFVIRAVPQLGCIRVDQDFYPVRATALLKSAQIHANMADEFDWGEYVIWHLGPAIRVSLDGRRETIYSEPRYQEGLNFMFGWNDWDAVLRKDGVDMALVKAKMAAYNLLKQTTEWDLAYEDLVSALFVRHTSSLVERIRASTPPEPLPPTGRLCFP